MSGYARSGPLAQCRVNGWIVLPRYQLACLGRHCPNGRTYASTSKSRRSAFRAVNKTMGGQASPQPTSSSGREGKHQGCWREVSLSRDHKGPASPAREVVPPEAPKARNGGGSRVSGAEGGSQSSNVIPALNQRMSWRAASARLGLSSKPRISSMMSPVSAGLVWVM